MIRWNLFEFGPDQSAPGIVGTRFTFRQLLSPNNSTQIERDPLNNIGTFGINPATERRIEIEGLSAGEYGALVTDITDRSITLVLDYVDGSLWFWLRSIVQLGTTGIGKKTVSVITLDSELNETLRINYFGCFPKKFEQFEGFRQDLQTKERLIISCDFSESA